MLQAVGERCLSVLLDRQGHIIKVGGGESTVFGFNPEFLVGKTLGTVVDVFKDAEADAEVHEYEQVRCWVGLGWETVNLAQSPRSRPCLPLCQAWVHCCTDAHLTCI